MIICLVGDPEDLSATYIKWLAEGRGAQVLELREEHFGVTWSYFLDDLEPAGGFINIDNQIYSFHELAGAFVRLNPQPGLPDQLDLTQAQATALIYERRVALQQLLNCAPFVVANRPHSGRSNGSKPFQMRQLAATGFMVPRWIVSNTPAAIQEFLQSCPAGAVYKSCSGLRSRVRLVDGKLLERMAGGTTPVVLQEYIPGRDVRVHVVNQHAFPTEAISHGVDYRFDTEGNQFVAVPMPPEVEELCHAAAAQEGLTLAGFDFRVTAEGAWHCLEVNPVPTFLPYEMDTGQPIGPALLDLFAAAQRG